MKRCVVLVLFVILALVGSLYAACVPTCPAGEDYVTKFRAPPANNWLPSGCGAGWSANLVPEYKFNGCCNAHDHCYASCGGRKETCDLTFRACMKTTCGTSLRCKALAETYYRAVQMLGCSAYKSSQREQCCE